MGGRKAGEGGCRIVYKLGGGNQRQLQNHVTAEAFFLLHGYYTNTMLALSLQYTLNRNFKNGAKILELIFFPVLHIYRFFSLYVLRISILSSLS